jgi:hypothetical protein
VNADEIAQAVLEHPVARDVFMAGYQSGLIHGRAEAQLDDEQLAEFAARLAIAQVEVHADARETARRAREFIDVSLAREKRRLANLNSPDSRTSTWEPEPPPKSFVEAVRERYGVNQ